MNNRQQRHLALINRRKQVSALCLQGWSQLEIAAHLEVSQSSISGDLRAIRRDWRDSTIRDFDELRALELRKLDLLEREAWAAWTRSQKPSQSAVVTGEGAHQAARKTMKHQVGDPRFLQQVHQCIAQRRAILGMDVLPALVPSENPTDAHLTLEVRRNRVLNLIAAISERERIGAAGAGSDPGQSGNVRLGNQ